MPRKIVGQCQQLSGKDHNGFIMIIAVIVVSALVSVILIQTSLAIMNWLVGVDTAKQGLVARLHAESCLQEALIRLRRNDQYLGGSPTIATGICNIVIGGVDNERTVDIVGHTATNYYHKLTVTVILEPFAVEEWDN